MGAGIYGQWAEGTFQGDENVPKLCNPPTKTNDLYTYNGWITQYVNSTSIKLYVP